MARTYAELSGFVKDVIDGTTGIGVIYTEPKDFNTAEEIENFCTFGMPPHLNVWFISRPDFKNSLTLSDGRPVPIGGVGARIHTLNLEGWYGYTEDSDPSSYSKVQDLCSSLMDNIQGKKSKANFPDGSLVLNTEEVSLQLKLGTFSEGYYAFHIQCEFVIEEMYLVSYI